MEKAKKALCILLAAMFAAALFATVFFGAFDLAVYGDRGFYRRAYKKYGVTDAVGMEMDEILLVTDQMLDYLRGGWGELPLVYITTIRGEEQDFFNDRDRAHMEDVKALFLGGFKLFYGAIAVCAVTAAALGFGFRRVGLRAAAHSVLWGFPALAAACGVLGAVVASDFSAWFVRFHELFFDNDLWLLDPATDNLIRILPEGFFADIAAEILVIFVVGLAVAIAAAAALLLTGRRRRAV